MIYKIGILGVSGRMGLEIAGLLGDGYQMDTDTLELSDAVASSQRLTSVEGIPVRQIEEPAREPVHAWIDFSRPAGTMALLAGIDCPIVIGTTGFSEAELAQIRKYSERQPVLLAPNTSPGMNLMMSFLERLPPSANLGYDVVLAEEHHHHKKDSPSGTAKALLGILEATGNTPVSVLVTRAGGIRGTHTVKLVSEDEEIVIEHRVMDRRLFARGALLGARFLMRKKQPGLYSMKDVFKG